MESLEISLSGEAKEFVEQQAALTSCPTPTVYMEMLIDAERLRLAERELTDLLLAGVRSPSVELTAEVWAEMRREADSSATSRRRPTSPS